MYTSTEVLIQNELQGLCTNCEHASNCSYRNGTEKLIIQCELYELNTNTIMVGVEAAVGKQTGLCMNCIRATACCLPGRRVGTWHCEEYE